MVSKPENNNFGLKTATENKCYISRKKKQSFFADIKLEIEQIRKKVEEKLIKPLFIENSIICKKRNDHKLSIKKLNALAWSCLTSELVGPITPEL